MTNQELSEILSILACPQCKNDLIISENKLKCEGCKVIFPIKNGIPVLLSVEAEPFK